MPPAIQGVETAVPVFIGYTDRASEHASDDLRNEPRRITSLLEFERYFGTPPSESQRLIVRISQTMGVAGRRYDPANVLTTQVEADFNEAKRSPYVLAYAVQLYFANGGTSCFIVSVGGFQSRITLAGLRRGMSRTEPFDPITLLIVPESRSLPLPDSRAFHNAALAHCAQFNRFLILDVPFNSPAQSASAAVATFRAAGVGTEGLQNGAAYAPDLYTTVPLRYEEDAVAVRYAVTDPGGTPTSGAPASTTLAQLPEPLRTQARNALRAVPNRLPPSGAIAGVYAKIDRERGVWKAPANQPLILVSNPTHALTDAEQASWNVDTIAGKSINAIRAFPGKGTLVWGARTLAGNDPEWRYVSVRRLALFVDKSIRQGTGWVVFEPNGASTWVKLRAQIEPFLTTLWRQGAFPGVKADEAFYVRCGLGQTMTAQDILDGRLVVEIGIAPVRPAEFVQLRFSYRVPPD